MWTCPACGNQIQHEEEPPMPRVRYRCHICRLELVFDDLINKLVAVPFDESNHQEQPAPSAEHR